MKLWIDDLRTPPDVDWLWAPSSHDAIRWLKFSQRPDMLWLPHEEVSFDHDLGGDDTSRPVVIWMIENEFYFDTYSVHTSNPVGREWLEGMIERYLL